MTNFRGALGGARSMRTAAAAELAEVLPGRTTRAGGWYRTRPLCHDGGSDNALAFRDGARPGESSLLVRCFSRDCSPNVIRHALQAVSGLALCRCEECWRSWRSNVGDPVSAFGERRTPAVPLAVNGPAAGGSSGGRQSYADRLWAAARVSKDGPAPDHPVGRWLRRRGVWPANEPLPAAVRWLSKTQLPSGQTVRSDSRAAGALVLGMRRVDDPGDQVRKVQLVAIDADGRKAVHWIDGDKRSYGADVQSVGILSHWGAEVVGADVHVCEGLADGLAILAGLPYEEMTGSAEAAWRYSRAGFVAVLVGAGKGLRGVDPGFFSSLCLWPDGDDPTALPAARERAQIWRDQGHAVSLERLPDGCDPADLARRRVRTAVGGG